MNFIQQAYKGKNDWPHYIAVILLVIIGWQIIGVLPLFFVATTHASNQDELIRSMQNNFTDLGIDNNLFLFVMILTFVFGLIALILGVKYIHKRSVTSLVTSRKRIDWKRFWTGFLIWGAMAGVVTIAGVYYAPEHYTWNFNPVPFFTLLIISLLMLPLQTSFEELLFRGYFMQGLGAAVRSKLFPIIFITSLLIIGVVIYSIKFYQLSILEGLVLVAVLMLFLGLFIQLDVFKNFINSNFNLKLMSVFQRFSTPLILTSVIFGLLHGANPEVEKLGYISMVFYIGTGLFYGIVTLMDEGTELALGLHAINNIVAAVLVTADWTALQTDALYIDSSEPSVGFEMFFPVLVLYPLMLMFFAKKYNWSNWKEKLIGKIKEPVY